MIRNLILIAVTPILFLQLSCLKDNTPSCEFVPCRTVAPAAEIQAVEAYLASNGISATKHCSGLYYRITAGGTGKSAEPCSNVGVKYTGRTVSGSVFDQRTTSPLFLSLSQVVTGWRIGIPLIKEGGTISLYIPPTLGYGNNELKDQNNNVVLPANAILVFDVELVSVQ